MQYGYRIAIVRPCLCNIFFDDYHNRDVTGKAKKELEVSQSELHALLG